jgi:predicted enzyme related to lactoylglutathione lyase
MDRNIICWFEIYVKDIQRAKNFYSSVLGNNFQDVPSPDGNTNMKMAFFSSMEETGNGVSGALIEMPGTKEGDGQSMNSMVYFACEDCAVEESKVVPAGGKVHQPKMSLGEHGFCSICVDTEGNAFGLYSMT